MISRTEILYRCSLPGVEIIPKPSYSRRCPATEAYHHQQAEISTMMLHEALILKVPVPLSGVAISFVATYGNRKRRDWSNVCKAIEDALVKAGIIADDNAAILAGADRCRVRMGSKNPGAVVELRSDNKIFRFDDPNYGDDYGNETEG